MMTTPYPSGPRPTGLLRRVDSTPPPPITYPPRPYQTTPGGLVHSAPSRRTRATHRSIKAAKAPHEDTYEVNTARPKLAEQAGIKQAGSMYNPRKDGGTPTPPRWTGIPAGLGETPPADARRMGASPHVNLKRDHEALNHPPSGSEDLSPYLRSSNPVTERPGIDRPSFESGIASSSSQMMSPRQQQQAMLAHQQGGLGFQNPMANLNQAQAQQLQAMRAAAMRQKPFTDLDPHLIQQQQRQQSMGPQHQDAMAKAAHQQAQQHHQMQAQQQAIAMQHAHSQSSNHSPTVQDADQTSVEGSPNIPVQSQGMQFAHPGMGGPASSSPDPSNFNGQQMTPVQMEAVRNGQMQRNYWRGGPQPGMMGPGSQHIDGPKAPEVNGFPRAQKETMRKLSTQHMTPAQAFSESARKRAIEKLENRSPAITNDRTTCSVHRFSRGELKYTISEDRTTDAFKRRKVRYIALGQSTSRAVGIEASSRSTVVNEENPVGMSQRFINHTNGSSNVKQSLGVGGDKTKQSPRVGGNKRMKAGN